MNISHREVESLVSIPEIHLREVQFLNISGVAKQFVVTSLIPTVSVKLVQSLNISVVFVTLTIVATSAVTKSLQFKNILSASIIVSPISTTTAVTSEPLSNLMALIGSPDHTLYVPSPLLIISTVPPSTVKTGSAGEVTIILNIGLGGSAIPSSILESIDPNTLTAAI